MQYQIIFGFLRCMKSFYQLSWIEVVGKRLHLRVPEAKVVAHVLVNRPSACDENTQICHDCLII